LYADSAILALSIHLEFSTHIDDGRVLLLDMLLSLTTWHLNRFRLQYTPTILEASHFMRYINSRLTYVLLTNYILS